MKSAKQRLQDHGYYWIKPKNIAPGSKRRIICGPKGCDHWLINSCDEAEELADQLLVKQDEKVI